MAGLRALSTADVIRVAITSYLQSFSEESSDISQATGRGEKIGSQQFDSARKLLDQCDNFSSATGNSVQRLVHYFCKALRERLNRETRGITSKGLNDEEILKLLHPEETMGSSISRQAFIACYKQIPFYQASVFAGIQAIIENVASAKRIHIIDLAIRTGVQYMALMQALATQQDCALELLKVTMVGITSNQQLKEIGKTLVYFAESLNLPFSFKIVKLTDIKDHKEEIFEIDEDEALAVYSPAMLSHIIRQPDHLENLITVLRKINPCVMVLIEAEVNHNSQAFEDRFFEALFHFSGIFDCLDVCMARCDPIRMAFEEMYPGQHIQNIIANEGEERIFRHMKIDGWRDFFNRFGIVEAELSSSSLFQAELVVKNFACGSSCTFDRNGECLIIGWKGIPHISLSAWKFQQE